MSSVPTRATVLIDGASVTILPRRAPVGNSGPIRGRTLAVFPVAAEAGSSADTPRDTGAPNDIAGTPNDVAGIPNDVTATPDRALSEALGTSALAATVEPGSRPAFAVLDLGEGEAATLGQSLGLAAILYWDGRRAHVLACDAAPADAGSG